MNTKMKSIVVASLSTAILVQSMIPLTGNEAMKQAAAAGQGRWLAGEYHLHTTQSKDAGEKVTTVQNILDAAFKEIDLTSDSWKDAMPWELPVQKTDAAGAEFDYLVMTEHFRPALRDPDGNAQDLAFYQGLEQQIAKVKELQRQGKYQNKIISSAFEWDMLGLDHAVVGIGTKDLDELIKATKEFEYLYSKETKDYYFAQEDFQQYGPRKNADEKVNTLDGVQWLKENYPDSYLLINHPSRKNGGKSELKIEDIRRMNDIAPEIVFGFEGILGNQMSNDGRGEVADVYGGADVMLAEVGGMWDALLGEGRRFYTFGNSDFHFKVRKDYSGGSYSGYWPGEYSRNYTWVEGNDITALANGLRSGKSFTVTGDLIDALDFNVTYNGNKAEMGEDLEVTEGDEMTLTIRFKSPNQNNYETIFGAETTTDKVAVDHIDLIVGEVTDKIGEDTSDYTKKTNDTTKVVKRFTSKDWTTDAEGYNVITCTVPVEKDTYYRLRGTNLGVNVLGETDTEGNPLRDEIIFKPTADQMNDGNYSDLWFYSNPIFVNAVEKDTSMEVDQVAAKTVVEMIDGLPATITLVDKPQVVAVRTAYDALTVAQQTFVTNYDVLTAAEAVIIELEKEENQTPDEGTKPPTGGDENQTPENDVKPPAEEDQTPENGVKPPVEDENPDTDNPDTGDSAPIAFLGILLSLATIGLYVLNRKQIN